MVLESTIICIDNSQYMRNGDFNPTRLQAQQVTPNDCMKFISGIKIAHLCLKHRQGKNHKTRIVAFVGSLIETDEKEMIKLAKKLKKEKVNIDVVNFGEDECNADILNKFISTINGKEGKGSHLVTILPGPHLSDALVTSPILQSEDGSGGVGGSSGAGFEFGVNPDDDPELALALRVSMEEQRARQQADGVDIEAPKGNVTQGVTEDESSEEALLQRALAMSMDTGDASTGEQEKDLGSMTEEEQIAYAMQMSMADTTPTTKAESMDVDAKDQDYSEVMNDPAFLQSVLQNLPGVDPQSDAMWALKDEKKKDESK